MKNKKILLKMVLSISVLLLAGCGNEPKESNSKTESFSSKSGNILSCVKEETEDDITIEGEYTFTFEKKTLEEAVMKVSYIVEDEEILEYFGEFDLCETMEEEMDELISNCKSTQKGKSIKATMNLNLDKLEEDDNNTFNFKKNLNINQLKKELEKDRYTCDIK